MAGKFIRGCQYWIRLTSSSSTRTVTRRTHNSTSEPIDTHQYLRMNSSSTSERTAATHIIANPRFLIAKYLASEEFVQRNNIFKVDPRTQKHLIKQRHWEQQLNNEIHRALAISRENSLQLRPNQKMSAHIWLVVTYHPILPTFQSITKRHLSTLHTSERLREAFLLPPLIAFCRRNNLRDFLVRATLTANNKSRLATVLVELLDVRRVQYFRPRMNSPAIPPAGCIKWILPPPVSPPILFI